MFADFVSFFVVNGVCVQIMPVWHTYYSSMKNKNKLIFQSCLKKIHYVANFRELVFLTFILNSIFSAVCMFTLLHVKVYVLLVITKMCQ